MLDESKIMFGDDIEYTMYMPDSVAETDWDAVVKVPFTVTGDIENTSYIYFGYEGECFSRAGSVRTLDIYLSNASVKFTEPGQTKQIQLFQKGEDKTTDAATTWSSADETVATVEAGLITSKGTGKTKISATYNKKTVSCSVRCYKDGIYIGDITTDSRPVKEYEFDASSAGNPKLQLWIYKNTTNYTQETWLSSNTDIAEITSGIQVEPLPGGGTTAIPNGKLTFKKNGTVTIYAAGRSLDDVWGSCTFKVTGFPRDSDYETGWVALNDYQMGHIYQQGIKLSNHDIMTQSFNQMFFENRLTAPVKADGCEFVIQLTSSAKNEGGGNGGGGGSSLADNMANPENQKILIDSAKENLSLWKMENDKRTEKVASVGDGLTLKDTDFDTSGNMVVTHRLSVDKGVLQKGQTYALLASGGIKAYTSGSLNKEAQYQFETLAPAKNIALNKDNLTLREGASETLTALLNEGLEDEADDLVIWTSSDDTVADVDNNGKVTAKKAGTATITATAKDGKVSADCAVTVIADPATQGGQNTGTTGSDQQIPVTGITLDKAKATMYVGKTRILKATVAPANASDKTVTWKSSKPKVAKVDKNGKVTARAAGKATITATTKDGGYTAKAVITVKTAKAKGVKLDRTAVTLTVGKARTLKATVLPDKATNKAVTWKSSDSRIAKVSRGGKVLGVAPGTATITVTTKDGGFAKKAWITVRPAVASFTLTAKKGSATIHYKKVKGVSGYEIYRADSKQGKYYKITTRTQRQKGICASSKLKTKHTYYYKVRTYKTVKGKKIYSSFSAVKKIKTK